MIAAGKGEMLWLARERDRESWGVALLVSQQLTTPSIQQIACVVSATFCCCRHRPWRHHLPLQCLQQRYKLQRRRWWQRHQQWQLLNGKIITARMMTAIMKTARIVWRWQQELKCIWTAVIKTTTNLVSNLLFYIFFDSCSVRFLN